LNSVSLTKTSLKFLITIFQKGPSTFHKNI
jgi:hypothetical protein